MQGQMRTFSFGAAADGSEWSSCLASRAGGGLGCCICSRNRNQPALGRPADDAGYIVDRAGRLCHFGCRNRGAGATLAFAGGEMGETMKRLLHVGIAVCCVVFAAQVMSSFIGQAAEISLLAAGPRNHTACSSRSLREGDNRESL